MPNAGSFSARSTSAKQKVILPALYGAAMKTGWLAEASCPGQNIRQVIYNQAADPACDKWYDKRRLHFFIIFQTPDGLKGCK